VRDPSLGVEQRTDSITRLMGYLGQPTLGLVAHAAVRLACLCRSRPCRHGLKTNETPTPAMVPLTTPPAPTENSNEGAIVPHFGDLLRRYRLAAGLSQEVLIPVAPDLAVL